MNRRTWRWRAALLAVAGGLGCTEAAPGRGGVDAQADAAPPAPDPGDATDAARPAPDEATAPTPDAAPDDTPLADADTSDATSGPHPKPDLGPGVTADGAVVPMPADAAAAPDDPDAGLGQSLDDVAPEDELATEAAEGRAHPAGGGETAIGWGETDNPELRELIPIGRSNQNAERFVIMRLRPADIPNLRVGDVVRAGAELQVTTRCDIGQVAPGCDYSPNVRMQIVLSGDRDGTDPDRQGTLALSDVKGFSCNKEEHHCVEVINFFEGSKTLNDQNAPGCVRDNTCFINLVVWSFDEDARAGGDDKLIIGANEGNFLDNGLVEQDRGRLMVVRERDVAAADKLLRVSNDNVQGGGIEFGSNGQDQRLYSHRLAGGRDLRAGEKFRVWAQVDAETDHRVNLSLQMFLTKNRQDDGGGHVEGIEPQAISEHNGTNCTPGDPCHIRKVTLFEVRRDVNGPVYVNISGSAEVPGPGNARVTVKNSGYVKSLRYPR